MRQFATNKHGEVCESELSRSTGPLRALHGAAPGLLLFLEVKPTAHERLCNHEPGSQCDLSPCGQSEGTDE